MRELYLAVLLEPDEDDADVYRASVPGLPGCISTLGSPRAALDSVRDALHVLLATLEDEEYRSLREEQAAIVPASLPPRSRIERVLIRGGRAAAGDSRGG